MLDRIQKEADRLNELVGELLQVTRVEADPSMQKTDTVHLDELLADLVYDSLLEAKAKDCTLLLKAPASAIVTGDEELIRRALENVIRNAIRYAPQRHGRRHRAGEVRQMPRLSAVRDYGPGVPDEALTRIFDPFYRVDSDRNRASGGLGLGLAIARRSVQLHKGKLTRPERASRLAGDHRIPHRPGGWQGAVLQAGVGCYSGFSNLMVDGSMNKSADAFLSFDLDRGRENLVDLLAVAVALDGEGPLDAVPASRYFVKCVTSSFLSLVTGSRRKKTCRTGSLVI